MPQTLLALLALTLSSVLVLNQQRLTTKAQTRMMTDELELAASGLASDILEFAEARSFDESTTPPAIEATQIVPSQSAVFVPATAFGLADRGTAGCNLLTPGVTPECDDLDDLSGLVNVPVSIPLANGRSVPFTATISVEYVSETASNAVSDTPTRHKRIVVSVRSRFVNGGRIPVLVSPRVISYDPVKASKDH
ncbi:MAG TPA: hypothetical protein VF594_07065, partial [Rubricoccaceae bacterium]